METPGAHRVSASYRGRRRGPLFDEERSRSAGHAASIRLRVVRVIAACTLLEAWRSRLPILVAAFIGAAFVAAGLAEEMAITEAAATRNILHGAMLRTCAVLALALFVVTSVVRDENDGVMELLLSLPRPRADYYFGKLAAGAAIAGGVAALCGLCLLPRAAPQPVLLWAGSLALELWIVVAASLFCVLALRHVAAAFLAVLALYLLARTIGVLRLISESPLAVSPGWWGEVVEVLVAVLYHILPDLGRFTSSGWLAYPPAGAGELLPLAGQALAFVALLSAAALFDLYRRDL